VRNGLVGGSIRICGLFVAKAINGRPEPGVGSQPHTKLMLTNLSYKKRISRPPRTSAKRQGFYDLRVSYGPLASRSGRYLADRAAVQYQQFNTTRFGGLKQTTLSTRSGRMRPAAIGQGSDAQTRRCASLSSRRMSHRCTASRTPRPDGNAPGARFRASQAARD